MEVKTPEITCIGEIEECSDHSPVNGQLAKRIHSTRRAGWSSSCLDHYRLSTTELLMCASVRFSGITLPGQTTRVMQKCVSVSACV